VFIGVFGIGGENGRVRIRAPSDREEKTAPSAHPPSPSFVSAGGPGESSADDPYYYNTYIHPYVRTIRLRDGVRAVTGDVVRTVRVRVSPSQKGLQTWPLPMSGDSGAGQHQ